MCLLLLPKREEERTDVQKRKTGQMSLGSENSQGRGEFG